MRWLTLLACLVIGIGLFGSPQRCRAEPQADGRGQSGETITVDLPDTQHLKNRGGSDGAGLCVFASISHAGRYQNDRVSEAMFRFMWTRPGGGYPEKVTRIFEACARHLGLPVPKYVQHIGGNVDFLRLALKTGRYPCVTYAGRDSVFYSGRIAHMVNLVHLSERLAVIHDNNFPGKYLWMTPDEFKARWLDMSGGWAIVLLGPPPPPVPSNIGRGAIRCESQNDSAGVPPFERTPKSESDPSSCSVCFHDEEAEPSFFPTVASADNAGYRWEPDLARPGYYWLYQGSRWIGTLHPDERRFALHYDNDTWSGTCDPPIPFPADEPAAVLAPGAGINNAIINYGIDVERIRPGEWYSLNGRECSRGEALDAIFGAELIDDRAKVFLTVVGDAEIRRRVRADMENHPALAEWRGKIHLQDYDSKHWMPSLIGLAEGITLQAPARDGSCQSPAIWRMRSYAGPEALAVALRKSDPSYRPDLDPDPNRPVTPTPSNQPNTPPNPSTPANAYALQLLCLGALTLATVCVLRRRK